MEYIKNPRTIKLLSYELKKICDDYWNGKIKEKQLVEYLEYISKDQKLLNDGNINKTVNLIIGTKRTELILKLLEVNQPQKVVN